MAWPPVGGDSVKGRPRALYPVLSRASGLVTGPGLPPCLLPAPGPAKLHSVPSCPGAPSPLQNDPIWSPTTPDNPSGPLLKSILAWDTRPARRTPAQLLAACRTPIASGACLSTVRAPHLWPLASVDIQSRQSWAGLSRCRPLVGVGGRVGRGLQPWDAVWVGAKGQFWAHSLGGGDATEENSAPWRGGARVRPSGCDFSGCDFSGSGARGQWHWDSSSCPTRPLRVPGSGAASAGGQKWFLFVFFFFLFIYI